MERLQIINELQDNVLFFFGRVLASLEVARVFEDLDSEVSFCVPVDEGASLALQNIELVHELFHFMIA